MEPLKYADREIRELRAENSGLRREIAELLSPNLSDGTARLSDGTARALASVISERIRQRVVEGYTAEHDDEHVHGDISMAAAAYAAAASLQNCGEDANAFLVASELWPWGSDQWNPANQRKNLVRAGALILAEIERIDRKAARSSTSLPANRG